MDNKAKACAVVAAAGSGQRMGGVSKPNITLLGKTLFEYVLGAFDASSVNEIVVVCSEDNKASLQALAKGFKKPIRFVLGGSTRAQSVFNGVSASDQDSEIICVHDCARPFVTPEMIDTAISAAERSGASCVCSPVTDTVKFRKDSGEIITPDRNKMFGVQTPQCFKKSLYFSSRSRAENVDLFTDETSLLENCGFQVEYLMTTENNMKLTSKSDVPLAEAIMKNKGDNR